MGLQWKDCVAVCTDEAAEMTKQTGDLQGRMKFAGDVPLTFTYCMIY